MKDQEKIFWDAMIEDNADPLGLGRCRVRVLGVHNPDDAVQPVERLPWAPIALPACLGSTSGTGMSSVPEPGSWVQVYFTDPDTRQNPIVVWALAPIHTSGGGGSGGDSGGPFSGGLAPNEDVQTVDWDGKMYFKPSWFQSFGGGANCEAIAKAFSKGWGTYQLADTPENKAAMIGSAMPESGGKIGIRENGMYSSVERIKSVFSGFYPKFPSLGYTVEQCVNSPNLFNCVYSGNLQSWTGNGPPSSGDGYLFRGGGAIQVTGRTYFTNFGKTVGKTPEDAANYSSTIEGGAMVACWYWKTHNIDACNGNMNQVVGKIGKNVDGNYASKISNAQKALQIIKSDPL